jgi:hypothetical protein
LLFSLSGFIPGTVLSEGSILNLVVEFDPLGPLGPKSAALTFLTDQGTTFGSPGGSFSFELQGEAVPEPSSLLLFGIAILAVIIYGWRTRKWAA